MSMIFFIYGTYMYLRRKYTNAHTIGSGKFNIKEEILNGVMEKKKEYK